FPRYSWRNTLPQLSLHYIRDHHRANAELARLPRGPLGFDLEWRPNYRKGQSENPVALVQLANADTILLLHITAMAEFPKTLKDLLESVEWPKAGVNIKYDCMKLYNDRGVSVRNCVELSYLARTVDNARWKGRYADLISLARLVEAYENQSLPKGRIQRSDWQSPLNRSQQHYAANDAHAGYTLHSRLHHMAQAMNPVPHRTYYAFSIVNGIWSDYTGLSPWIPHNPFYDPGPLPPPRETKHP
ncbi:ribonuclease H-like domain-containing protein, partial [Phlebopus sp. FC_14]